jgi:lycopene beta-cyclase
MFCSHRNRQHTWYCFNSIYNKAEVENQTKYPVLQQHFIGWFIKVKKLSSIQTKLLSWIFRWNKRHLFYVCSAYSTTEALLEYTLFSHDLLPKEEYEQEIEKYIENSAFTISK